MLCIWQLASREVNEALEAAPSSLPTKSQFLRLWRDLHNRNYVEPFVMRVPSASMREESSRGRLSWVGRSPGRQGAQPSFSAATAPGRSKARLAGSVSGASKRLGRTLAESERARPELVAAASMVGQRRLDRVNGATERVDLCAPPA